MPNPLDFAHQYFEVLFGATLGWLVFCLAASVIYRRVRGKYLFLAKPPGLTFSEDWTSGRSLQSWWTQLGGARNCLFVGVGSQFVYVLPHFPFNLLFLPEVYGLEHVIPRDRISRVASGSSVYGDNVRIIFTTEAGTTKEVALRLRRPEQFLQSVGCNEQSAP